MCREWRDHEWGEPVFKETGRHEVAGRFQRFAVTCEKCGRVATETRWLDQSPTLRTLPEGEGAER